MYQTMNPLNPTSFGSGTNAEGFQFRQPQQHQQQQGQPGGGCGFLCSSNFCGGPRDGFNASSLLSRQQQRQFQCQLQGKTIIESSLPRRHVSPRELENLIASDLQTSSYQERENIYADLHAVSQGIQESPEFIQAKIEQLKRELNEMKLNSDGTTAAGTTAYELAESISYDYVHNRKFQLMFLRSAMYDCRLAAEKFTTYMDQKLALFGIDYLCKDITQNELDMYDKEALDCGMFTKVPNIKDRAGRSICCLFIDLTSSRSIENMMRAQFYTLNSVVMDDENVQLKGVVVAAFLEDIAKLDFVMQWNLARMRSSFPIRYTGVHFCYRRSQSLQAISSLMLAVNPAARKRMRWHTGGHIDCMYAMQTYGIPAMDLPLTHDGIPTSDSHKLWIRELREREEQRRRQKFPLKDDLFDDSEFDNYDDGMMMMMGVEEKKATETVAERVISGSSSSEDDWMMDFVQEGTERNNDSNNSFQSIGSTEIPAVSVGQASGRDEDVLMADAVDGKNNRRSSQMQPQNIQKQPQNTPIKSDSVNFTELDVLFGRGKGSQNHPGNVRFHRLLDQHIDEYDKASKLGKTALSEKIIKIINESSGRFLKQDENGSGELEEVDLITAREKVSRAFRARRRLMKNKRPGGNE